MQFRISNLFAVVLASLMQFSIATVAFASPDSNLVTANGQWVKSNAGFVALPADAHPGRTHTIAVPGTPTGTPGGGGYIAVEPTLEPGQRIVASNAVYIDQFKAGIVYGVYVTLQYEDGTSRNHVYPLNDAEIAFNRGRWVRYSMTIVPAEGKALKRLLNYGIVWHRPNNPEFVGRVIYADPMVQIVGATDGTAVGRPSLIAPHVAHDDTNPARSAGADAGPFVFGNGQLAAHQTSVRVQHDGEHLMLHWSMREAALNPVHNRLDMFRAGVRTHDGPVYTDDCVELFLQPPGSDHYFQIVVNSLGTVYDAKVAPALRDPSWESGVVATAEVLREQEEWRVSLRIPMRSMLPDGTPLADSEWRMNLCRNERPFNEVSAWAPTGVFNEPASFGYLKFGSAGLGIGRPVLGDLLEGRNGLVIPLSNLTDQPLESTITVRLAGSDLDKSSEVSTTASLAPGESRDVRVEYERGSDARYFEYAVASGGKTVAQSPRIHFPRQSIFFLKMPADAQRNRFITRAMPELYVNEGEYLHLPTVIFGDAVDGRHAELTLDVPSYLELLSPISADKSHPQPEAVEANESLPGRNSYKLRFNLKSLTTSQLRDANNYVVHPLFLRSRVLTATHEYPVTDTIKYSIALPDGTQQAGAVPVHLLPMLLNRSPDLEQVRLDSWPSGEPFFYGYYRLLSESERELVFRSMLRSGFNSHDMRLDMKDIVPFLYAPDAPKASLAYGFHISVQSLSRGVPELAAYMAANPQLGTRQRDGEALPRVISPAFLTADSEFVKILIDQYLARLARLPQLGTLKWNHENPLEAPLSIGFDEANFELFRKAANLPADAVISIDTVSKQYRDAWIDFRTKQTADFVAMMREGLRKASPKTRFTIYSSYHSPTTKAKYGMDWAAVGPHIDEAWCGYGRIPALIDATRQALAGTPLVAGEIIWMGDGTHYGHRSAEINLFQRAVESGGGTMLWYDWVADARVFTASSRLGAVLSDLGSFFGRNYQRDAQRVRVTGGAKDQVMALRNPDGELAIFAFNPGGAVATYKLTVDGVGKDHVAIDYWNKRKLPSAADISIEVPPYQVGVVFIGRDASDGNAPGAPRIDKDRSLADVLVLNWDDPDARTRSWLVEVAATDDFAADSIVASVETNQPALKVAVPAAVGDAAFVRVRALDLATGRWSAYSAVTKHELVRTQTPQKETP